MFNHIGTGVIDFVNKPMEGFVKGPLEGTVGMIEGTGSLVKNTFAGTMNSLGKITGSLAGGLSSLTLDEEYMAKREKLQQKKPKHLIQGLGQGL